MGKVYLALYAAYALFLQTDTARGLFAALTSSAEGKFLAGPVAVLCTFALCWHGYGAVQNYFDQHRELSILGFKPALYKAHRKDTAHTYRSMLPRVLFNQLQIVAGVLAVYWYGSGFRMTLPLPSIPELVAHTLLNYLCYEVIFYATHRALHLPALMPYHKMHHDTFASVGVSGMYQGSLDYFLTTTLAQIVGPVLFDTHVTVTYIMVAIGGLNSIHSHGCYNFPGFPSTREHDFHHANWKVNYATGPLDMLLGTYMARS